MDLYTAAGMRRADAAAAELGVPGQILMENAGRAVAEALRARWPHARRALVLCGPGNNGGDGYVAARHLRAGGLDVEVFEVRSDPSGDAATARAALLPFAAPQPLEPGDDALGRALARADIALDALLGSGLSRPLEGVIADAVRALRGAATPLLAVDVPSGVRSDRGDLPELHLRADLTVQLAGPKVASALEPARSAFGAAPVADIGMPPAALAGRGVARLIDDAAAAAALPRRDGGAHKYRAGTVLLLAGSDRYLGAADLACRGALRAGAGLVTLASPRRPAGLWPEAILLAVDLERDPEAPARLPARRRGVPVIGPGLEPGPAAFAAVRALLAASSGPALLDAGALDGELRSACRAHGGCVLTPHVGEAARLLDAESGEVLTDPLGAAARLAEAWNAVVALKGATTVIAGPDGSLRVAVRGHPGMATGGAGDVLAGALGALLAEAAAGADGALEPARAARIVAAGCHLHGRAGERAAARHGLGLRASEIADALGEERAALERGAPERASGGGFRGEKSA